VGTPIEAGPLAAAGLELKAHPHTPSATVGILNIPGAFIRPDKAAESIIARLLSARRINDHRAGSPFLSALWR
jgi:hypothetical protein